MRHLRVFLGLLCLCVGLAAPAWATVRYVDQPTGNNADSGLTEALAKETLKGAVDVSVAGDTIRVCNGAIHRMYDLANTVNSGTASQHITLTNYNCTTIRNSLVRPIITPLSLVTGWTTCTGNVGQCSVLSSGEKAKVWWASQSVNPYATVLQDADKQCGTAAMVGVTHRGYTCDYDPANPSTHMNLDHGWHPNRSSWTYIAPGSGNNPPCCATNSCTPVSCPAHLASNNQWCYNTAEAKLYTWNDADPDTFSNPGFEALSIATTGATQPMLLIDRDYWDVSNLVIRGAPKQALYIGFNARHITVTDVELSFSAPRTVVGNACSGCGTSDGQPLVYLLTNVASDVIQDVTFTRVVRHDSGRDQEDLSKNGSIADYLDVDGEMYNSFAHGGFAACHNGTPCQRSNIVLTNLNVHNGGGPNNGANSTAVPVTFNGLYSHDHLTSLSDPRIPACAAAGVPASAVFLNGPGTVTLNRCLLVRAYDGLVAQHAGLTVNATNCTIVGNSRMGIEANTAGATVNLSRSIVANNGVNTDATASSAELGGNASANWTGGKTAATQNVFLHHTTGRKPFFEGGVSKTLGTWQARSGTPDTSSQVADPLFVSATNVNLTSTSPAVNSLSFSPACPNNTQGDPGALEIPTVPTVTTVDTHTLRATVCAIETPITVTCGLMYVCVNPAGGICDATTTGTARTVTACPVEAGGASLLLTVSGASMQPSDVLKLYTVAGAIKSGKQVGGTNGVAGERLAVTSQSITNTLTGGTDPPPLPISCLIPDTASDVTARITFSSGVAGNMLPASGATGITFDDNGVDKTMSGTGTRIGVNEFEFTTTTAFVTGHTVRVKAVASNITGSTGVALADFAYGAIANCVNQVAAPPAAPTLLLATVAAEDLTTIVATLDPAGGAIVPATGATGLAVDAGHTVSASIDRINVSQYAIPITPPFVYGEAQRQLCYTQGTASPITNGTTELAAGCKNITNNAPAPPAGDGVLAQTHARCALAGETFTQGLTIRDAVLDAPCYLPPGATAQEHLEFSCSTNDCPAASHIFQACDSTNCTSSNAADANWYTLTDDCTGHLACYGQDVAVTNGAATTASLSGCTLDGGTFRKVGGMPSAPFAMTATHCGKYVAVVKLSSLAEVGTDYVDLRLVKSDTTRFTTYTVLGRIQAVQAYAVR
jgi:hypothetical protein